MNVYICESNMLILRALTQEDKLNIGFLRRPCHSSAISAKKKTLSDGPRTTLRKASSSVPTL